MKCKACGSEDVTQSHGKCNECRWIYEQEQKFKKEQKENKKKIMHNLFDFLDEEVNRLEKFVEYWIKNHRDNPNDWPLALNHENSGLWFEQYIAWRKNDE